MNRTELVQVLAERTQSTKDQADAHLTALADVLIDVVNKGDKLQLMGLMTVERVERAARTGRNPRTGEPIKIPANFGVKITPGKKLKDAASK